MSRVIARPLIAGVLGILAGAALAGWLLVRHTVVVTVSGRSMEPTLRHGDRLLAVRIRSGAGEEQRLRVGDLVVLVDPDAVRADGTTGRRLVKRVAALAGASVPVAAAGVVEAGQLVPRGHLMVLGDNPDVSYDSRRAGFIPADRVLGRIVRPLAT